MALMELRAFRDRLPTWGDGERTYWIMFCRREDGDIEKGPMLTHDFEAYVMAEWLVQQGFFHKAWIAAVLTEPIVAKRDDHVG